MNYSLTVQPEHMRMIIAALAELPYKMAAPAIESILKQTDEQDKARADAEQARKDAAAAAAFTVDQKAPVSEAQAAI